MMMKVLARYGCPSQHVLHYCQGYGFVVRVIFLLFRGCYVRIIVFRMFSPGMLCGTKTYQLIRYSTINQIPCQWTSAHGTVFMIWRCRHLLKQQWRCRHNHKSYPPPFSLCLGSTLLAPGFSWTRTFFAMMLLPAPAILQPSIFELNMHPLNHFWVGYLSKWLHLSRACFGATGW
jgi:hypothetical protein